MIKPNLSKREQGSVSNVGHKSLSFRAGHKKSPKIIFNRRLKPNKIMTICIATICEANTGYPRIVFTADRLVTDDDGYTFELGVPKANSLSSKCFIMEAGDSFTGERIIEHFNSRLTQEQLENMSVSEIVREFADDFKAIFAESVENDIFKARGLTRKEFYENFAKYPDWFSLTTDQQVRGFDLGVSFIIMGIDIDKQNQIGTAYIYRLIGCGEPENFNRLGFVIVGIGEKLSLPEYTQEKYSPNNALEDAIVRTFWAKKTAERMAGVGKTTDFGLIWLEAGEQNKSEIKCKNALFDEKLVEDYLEIPFENSRKELGKIRNGIKENLSQFFRGKSIS